MGAAGLVIGAQTVRSPPPGTAIFRGSREVAKASAVAANAWRLGSCRALYRHVR